MIGSGPAESGQARRPDRGGGNPLEDLSAMEEVEMVVQGGEVVTGAASTEPE